MAFGIKKHELEQWKSRARSGNIAILTHYWYDERFPELRTVTKVACSNMDVLKKWGRQYGLKPEWIHMREDFPHFDLLGERQLQVLKEEGCLEQINRFQ
ncbi:hypothetical protein [Texcoconibacillus texcoconensis]|uniref:YneQ n=1 Tax=Texcoconibacillus texcoconensis TaxID=1095777 RepID=A0A840QSI4_9BACI|nr:hypothetical protein [Texcoconibacillus texcoconensis]MBB5174472.1 hypothetical protein [Texcoconibacillus texcoconensis]